MNLKDALEGSRIHQLVVGEGRARRDMLLACCLVLAHAPRIEIRRVIPDANHLSNAAICVLGSGGAYDPEIFNLDPRHVPHSDDLCAFSLLLHELRDLNHARSIWPWLKFTEILENEGPNAAARAYRLHRGASTIREDWNTTTSPVENTLIRMLSETRTVRPGDELHTIMKRVGMDLRTDLTESRRAFASMSVTGQMRTTSNGLRLLWMPAISGVDSDKWMTGFCKTIMPRPDLVVSPFRRGTGWFIRFAARMNFRPVDLAEKLGPKAIAAKGGVSIETLTWETLVPAVEELL